MLRVGDKVTYTIEGSAKTGQVEIIEVDFELTSDGYHGRLVNKVSLYSRANTMVVVEFTNGDAVFLEDVSLCL